MSDTGFINSIDDYEAAYGSPFGRLAYGNYGLQTYAWGSKAKKADAPLVTTTSGTLQRIVGPQLWANLNTDRQLFAALRKKEWTETGIRVITGYPTNGGTTNIRAIAESSSAVGDSLLPSFAQYFPTVKLMETKSNQSLFSRFHGQIAEGVSMEQYRDFIGVSHGKGINQTLNTKVANGYASGGNSFTSIDSVIGAFTEIGAHGLAAGDLDIYGLDRDAAASFADAQVLHNSGTTRDLTLRLINSLQRVTMSTQGTSGAASGSGDYNPDNYFFYTGPDTWQSWGELLQPQQRFDEAEATFSPLDGVALGMHGTKNTTFRLAKYGGSPIILSSDCPADTISRLYYAHRDHLWFQVVQPTVYREVGVSTGQELLTTKYRDEMLYYTVGELVTNFFGANGKLEDLK